jgi:hypothetical protein
MSVVAVRRSLRLGERYATAPELTSSRRSPFRSGCTDPGTDASVLLLGYVRSCRSHMSHRIHVTRTVCALHAVTPRDLWGCG